jgi:long-subunit fatty acid transport protein
VFFGNGFNINEKLRLGIDVSYLFGQSSRSSMVYYPDSILIFGTKVESKVRGGDFIFDYGVQYDIDLNSTTQATIGITYANKFNLKAKRNYLSKTLSGGFNGEVEIVKDTIEYLSDEKGTIILPQRLGIGFAVVKEGIWLVGADFEWQNWTEFGAFNVSDTLSNSFRLTVGGEFTPVHSNISSLFKRMTYRAGLRYNQSYLNFDGTHINEFGISFGFGFPMKKSKTEIDLGFEFGRRGTTDNKLVQENFINFFLGVSIKEHWFQKRKYK